jgi:hypothetical protein
MFRFPGDWVEQNVRISESGVIPRHPLNDVEPRVRRGHAIRSFLHLNDLFAESAVPVENPVRDSLNKIARGIGRVMENERLTNIEPRNTR